MNLYKLTIYQTIDGITKVYYIEHDISKDAAMAKYKQMKQTSPHALCYILY